MSYVPDTLRSARLAYITGLKRAGFLIESAAVGILGDDSHAKSGSSYHLGKDALKDNSYSIVESPRDHRGLTDAASAIDLGWFSFVAKGKLHNLRSFSGWLVEQCRAKTSDSADIREVIYSLDGKTVHRWDRLGIRNSGDSSHLTHTHVSRFRDAENSNSFTRLITRYFTEIGVIEGDDMPLDANDQKTIRTIMSEELTSFGKRDPLASIFVRTDALANRQAPALLAAVANLTTLAQRDDVDEQAIAAAVLAGLDASAIAAAIPSDLAQRVADELHTRLAS